MILYGKKKTSRKYGIKFFPEIYFHLKLYTLHSEQNHK